MPTLDYKTPEPAPGPEDRRQRLNRWDRWIVISIMFAVMLCAAMYGLLGFLIRGL